MSKYSFSSFFLLFAVSAAGCTDDSPPADSDIREEALEAGLYTTGKADGKSSVVELHPYSYAIGLRHAAARTLYNLLHDNGAYATVGGGKRLLRAPGVACITDGLQTYCRIRGYVRNGDDSYAAFLHGGHYSAANTLYRLIAQGSGESFVQVPWFACERQRHRVWCGIEQSEMLGLEFDGLEDSGEQFVYEGWAVHGGVPTTTDRFRNGPEVVQYVPKSIAADSLYVLTIEPRRNDLSSPAETHLLAGGLELGGKTAIGTEHPAAIGTDFAEASGGYILATPSSETRDDETQGVWFVDPAARAPSLNLPALPQGWTYEGWVVGEDGPVSTGTFTSPAGEDSDGAGPTSGPRMGPPFPGQDFVNPPMDLVGGAVVVSVEPVPDNSPLPFAIKPLIDDNVEAVLAPTLQDLANTSENRPSAMASLGI